MALAGLFRSRASLAAEILVLRRQFTVLRRNSPKRQIFTPESAAQALQEYTAGRSADDRSPDIPGGSTYQQHARTGTVDG
jgi:hypothetical protein